MKVVANIATRGNRPKELIKTIMSLKDQCDEINVWDNSKGGINYTDNAKFYYLQAYQEPVYYLGIDDDIIYAPNFVERLKYFIDNYEAIISFHGRILKEPVNSYYKGHTIFDYRHELKTSKYVDVVGTGVLGFRTDYFNPIDLYKSEFKCMSDLVFSLEAKKQGKTLICAEHERGWLQAQYTESGIMQSQINTYQTNQINLAKEIMRL